MIFARGMSEQQAICGAGCYVDVFDGIIVLVIDDIADEPDFLPGFGTYRHVLPDNATVIVDAKALACLGIPGIRRIDDANAALDRLDAVDCREALLALDHEQRIGALDHEPDGT